MGCTRLLGMFLRISVLALVLNCTNALAQEGGGIRAGNEPVDIIGRCGAAFRHGKQVRPLRHTMLCTVFVGLRPYVMIIPGPETVELLRARLNRSGKPAGHAELIATSKGCGGGAAFQVRVPKGLPLVLFTGMSSLGGDWCPVYSKVSSRH